MGDLAKKRFCQLLGCISLGMLLGKLSEHPNQVALLKSGITVQKFNNLMGEEDFKLIIIEEK